MKRIIGALFLVLVLSCSFSELTHAQESNLSSGVPVQGVLNSEGSINKYSFTTTADGEVYIGLDKTTASFSVVLYDAYGNEITSNEASYAGETAVLDEKLKKGKYYVEIKSYRWDGVSKGTYQLKVTYPGSFKRDATTFEPNDTFETGMGISSGTYYKSKIENVIDKDTYQFSTNKDGEVYLTLDQVTAGLEVSLYDGNGNEITSETSWSAGENRVIHEKVKKGKYYVVVKPESYVWDGITSATYRFKVTYPGSIKRDLSTYETNDTFETAYSIISNQYYKSKHESEIDRDVYQFTTIKDGKVTITLDQVSEGAEIALCDGNGNEIGTDYAFNDGDKTAVISESLKKGKYYIVLEPESWDGVTSQTYRIKASYPDKTPTVSSITDHSTTITGNAETNAKVYAYAGSKQLGTATSKNGKYTIKISKQKAGTSIQIYLIDSKGIKSGSKIAKVLDKTSPKTPTVNAVTDHSTTIAGNAEINAKVYAWIGSKKLGVATAKSGKYSMKISKQKANSVIKVYAVDSAGNKSGTKSLKVLDKTVPSAPSVNKVTTKTTTITGKGEKYTTVYVYNKSKKVGTAKLDKKGQYKVKIKKQKKNVRLTIYLKDAAGNKSKSKTVKVY
ncbi:Ig-like domain-containing protein [Bacillus sp. FSL R5-0416]|uniref:Ig-like domain-containing protein n=1 Tax=Bacillus sp. FSL R5-0416 TaxID=2975299 RepID=UPI0030CF9069